MSGTVVISVDGAGDSQFNGDYTLDKGKGTMNGRPHYRKVGGKQTLSYFPLGWWWMHMGDYDDPNYSVKSTANRPPTEGWEVGTQCGGLVVDGISPAPTLRYGKGGGKYGERNCWYVAEGSGEERGPWSTENMMEYIRTGIVAYDRKIRHKAHDELVEAYRYSGQFPELAKKKAAFEKKAAVPPATTPVRAIPEAVTPAESAVIVPAVRGLSPNMPVFRTASAAAETRATGGGFCPARHPLEHATYSSGVYQTGWRCDCCCASGKPKTPRWCCRICTFDVCTACRPVVAPVASANSRTVGGEVEQTPLNDRNVQIWNHTDGEVEVSGSTGIEATGNFMNKNMHTNQGEVLSFTTRGELFGEWTVTKDLTQHVFAELDPMTRRATVRAMVCDAVEGESAYTKCRNAPTRDAGKKIRDAGRLPTIEQVAPLVGLQGFPPPERQRAIDNQRDQDEAARAEAERVAANGQVPARAAIEQQVALERESSANARAQTQQLQRDDGPLQAELDALRAKIAALEAADQARAEAAARHAILDALPTFYHGTSLEAGLAIQAGGFRVDLSGTNAGTMLGDGVYITTTLEKALNYAKPKPQSGCVLQLKVDLGRMYTLKGGTKKPPDDPLRKKWFKTPHNYDSCFSPAGYIGAREEHCVRDAKRVNVVFVTLGHTGHANAACYFVRGNKLILDTAARDKLAAEKAAREKPAFAMLSASFISCPGAIGQGGDVGPDSKSQTMTLQDAMVHARSDSRIKGFTFNEKRAGGRSADTVIRVWFKSKGHGRADRNADADWCTYLVPA